MFKRSLKTTEKNSRVKVEAKIENTYILIFSFISFNAICSFLSFILGYKYLNLNINVLTIYSNV